MFLSNSLLMQMQSQWFPNLWAQKDTWKKLVAAAIQKEVWRFANTFFATFIWRP